MVTISRAIKTGYPILNIQALMGFRLFKVGSKKPIVIWAPISLPKADTARFSGYTILNGLFSKIIFIQK